MQILKLVKKACNLKKNKNKLILKVIMLVNNKTNDLLVKLRARILGTLHDTYIITILYY